MVHTLARPAAADEYDGQYRAWLEQHGPRALDLDWRLTHLEWRQRVLLRRYPPEGKRVLDFGCMDGVFTLRLQQMGAEAVGYDISPAAIAQAKQFRATAARPVFTTVPPGPGQFDLIYCSEALENVGDDSALVGELVGYLAPGGSVVGTTPIGEEGRRSGQAGHLRSGSAQARAVTLWPGPRVPLRAPPGARPPAVPEDQRRQALPVPGYAAESSGRTLIA